MDLRSWRNRWNNAALPQISSLPGESPTRTWPLLGMLALGLVAGAALGGYAVSQRSQMRRLAQYAHRMRAELAGMPESEVEPLAYARPPRTNHRRKATSEV
jgi:hypothetical protein